jgi:O-methyltransferase involved in polyketide biosynthesis
VQSLTVFPAAYRAVESREKDALFQDPMAESLAGEQAIQQVTMMLHITDGIKY